MKIYISYFGKIKKIREKGIEAISIARITPTYYFGAEMKCLAPEPYMLNYEWNKYKIEFAKILARLNAKKILKQIEKLSGGKDVALLCYEKSNETCHRKLVADWIKEKTGIEVVEFGEVKKYTQLSLF